MVARRRTTTAKQKAASKANLVKARAARKSTGTSGVTKKVTGTSSATKAFQAKRKGSGFKTINGQMYEVFTSPHKGMETRVPVHGLQQGSAKLTQSELNSGMYHQYPVTRKRRRRTAKKK